MRRKKGEKFQAIAIQEGGKGASKINKLINYKIAPYLKIYFSFFALKKLYFT